MNIRWLLLYLITLPHAFAQADKPRFLPEGRIVTLTFDTQGVNVLHLRPGYVSCVRLPEDISTVVLGNPSLFRAEHSDAEPRMVSLKPTTPRPAETNVLITTKTGREVALHLVSGGSSDNAALVDFVLEYDRPRGVLIEAMRPSVIVSQTQNLTPKPLPSPATAETTVPNIARLSKQQRNRKPHWQGKQLRVDIEAVTMSDQRMVVAFSVMNASDKTIELLPPQVQLAGRSKGGQRKAIKAKPIAIKDFAVTSRRLGPGARADGIATFERPSFKESNEQMLLQIAQAAEVDRPVLVPIAFVPPDEGGGK
jgi:hypothetical protein